MLFINKGESMKVRLTDGNGYFWKTARQNEIIDLPEEIGLIHGFEIVEANIVEPVAKKETTKGKIGNSVVETKQFEDEIKSLKGFGKKTMRDLIALYPTRESLVEAIRDNVELPIRDDLDKKLRKHFR